MSTNTRIAKFAARIWDAPDRTLSFDNLSRNEIALGFQLFEWRLLRQSERGLSFSFRAEFFLDLIATGSYNRKQLYDLAYAKVVREDFGSDSEYYAMEEILEELFGAGIVTRRSVDAPFYLAFT